MKKVAIVTDSTAYLPQEYIDSLPIRVIPLTVNWDGKSYRDGIDIKPDEFYTRLSKSSTMPTTSQATVKDFSDVYEALAVEDYDILTLPISSGISGTINSAYQAQKMFPNASIEVMETKLVSMALGFQVLAAARAAKDGASLQDVKEIAAKAYEHIGVYFVVDTLKYLHAGGRIGGAKRWVGTALKIKPVLEIRDGKIEAVKSVYTFSKALDSMIELVEKDVNGRTPVRVSVFHALADEAAQKLLDRTVKHFNAEEGILSYVSPVVGSHVGPGTISIAYMAGM
jgi:DegV family protein with EDD domain